MSLAATKAKSGRREPRFREPLDRDYTKAVAATLSDAERLKGIRRETLQKLLPLGRALNCDVIAIKEDGDCLFVSLAAGYHFATGIKLSAIAVRNLAVDGLLRFRDFFLKPSVFQKYGGSTGNIPVDASPEELAELYVDECHAMRKQFQWHTGCSNISDFLVIAFARQANVHVQVVEDYGYYDHVVPDGVNREEATIPRVIVGRRSAYPEHYYIFRPIDLRIPHIDLCI